MKLHWSPRSPFVRKVMIVLCEKDLLSQVELVRSVVAMSAPPNPEVLHDNPLGKIPTLVLDNGKALFDSRVICEYLDNLGAGRRLIPASFEDRVDCLRWQALGDGLTDILLLWRTEMARGGSRNDTIASGFDVKVRKALAVLDDETVRLRSCNFGLGHVAIVCALGQLDFRFSDCGWRRAHPYLAEWCAGMQQRPSVLQNPVTDDGRAADEITMPLTFTDVA